MRLSRLVFWEELRDLAGCCWVYARVLSVSAVSLLIFAGVTSYVCGVPLPLYRPEPERPPLDAAVLRAELDAKCIELRYARDAHAASEKRRKDLEDELFLWRKFGMLPPLQFADVNPGDRIPPQNLPTRPEGDQ